MKITQKLLTVCALLAPLVKSFEVTPRLWSESEDLANAFVEQMTLDEKINMVTGSGNSFGPCIGYVSPIERLGFKGLCLQDGPAGVRSASPSTGFPAGLNIASTFDADLMRELGVAMGEEFRAKGVNVMLGPAMNMYRSPAAGRNWEGFGEDTYLATVASKNVVAGIQSQGVLATAKHFAGNEQEYKRETSNSIIDERVLNEVYFPPFKAAVVSGAGAFMSAYNHLNGIASSNNTALLNKTLKKKFLFHGFVMSDWWGTKDKYGITNGLDLNMPGGKQWGPTVTESYWGEELKEAVESGEIDSYYLDESCKRIMTMLYKYRQMDEYPEINLKADGTAGHAELVRKAAAASVVILKNESELLPISAEKYKKIAIIGDGALPPRICTDMGCTEGKHSGVIVQGWGSGTTNFEYISDPLSAITERAQKDGIEITSFTEDDSNTSKAAEVASDADLAVVVVVANSGEGYLKVEGNSGDRNDLDLWHNGNELVAAVAAANKNTLVVIYSPGVVNLPFNDDVSGIVYAGMPGQEAGHGLADVLFNDVAPSGKLPFTWGKAREDYCCDITYGNDDIIDVPYNEGFYIGYKWFDKEKIKPLYSFGHGLTYTDFEINVLEKPYWNVQTQRLLVLINGISTIFNVKNTGKYAGYVTPQVYVTFPTAEDDPRIGTLPEINFKNFTKVYLEPGESKDLNLLAAYNDIKYYNVTNAAWEYILDGNFTISIGFSHDDIVYQESVGNYHKTPTPPPPYCFALSDGYECCFDNEVVYEDETGKWGINDKGEWCGVEQPRFVPEPETTTTFTYPEPTIFGNPKNIYEEAEAFYVFPDYQKQVKSSVDQLIADGELEIAELAKKVARYPTPTWLANNSAVEIVPRVLKQVKEQMVETGKKILTSFIVYNLPNRDCSAEASKGELGIEHLGFYKEWIDQIAGNFTEHPGPIVAVIEPDALGNMVNKGSEECAEAFDTQMEALVYAITHLALPNVSVYMDLAQVGWLGWGANMRLLVPILEELLNKVGTGKLRGFTSNISNYQPLTDPEIPEKTLSGNSCQSEYSYSMRIREELKKIGCVDFGWVIDTSRNGVSNIKDAGESWCNIAGAGIGRRPEANPADLPGLDAVYWFKPPGESDGSDRLGQPGYDPSCTSIDSLTDSPRAGMWYHKQFVELVTNANPSFVDEEPFEFPDFSEPTTTVPVEPTTTATPTETVEPSKCWSEALGFPCCEGQRLIYEDADGPWGYENDNWCGIVPVETECWSEKLGFKCCNDCNAVYTDADGPWGFIFETNEWCGIPTTCAA